MGQDVAMVPEEYDSYTEMAEILADRDLMRVLCTSEEDVRAGRVLSELDADAEIGW